MEEQFTRIAISNITIVAANTEYEYQFPKGVRRFRIQCRDGTTFIYAFQRGKVHTATPPGPYGSVLANGHLEIANIEQEELYLYVAGTAGKIVEVVALS